PPFKEMVGVAGGVVGGVLVGVLRGLGRALVGLGRALTHRAAIWSAVVLLVLAIGAYIAKRANAFRFVLPTQVVDIAASSDISSVVRQAETISWQVSETRPDCQLTGHIDVVDGAAKDIQVFVATSPEANQLLQGHRALVFLSTDKITSLNL